MAHRGRRNADQVLLKALACGATNDAAATQAGVNPATVYRRKLDPAFCKELEQLKSDMFQRTAAMLNAAGMESVKNLLELQKNASHAVRLGASRTILETGAKFRESAELEKRLQSLEEQLILNANNQ